MELCGTNDMKERWVSGVGVLIVQVRVTGREPVLSCCKRIVKEGKDVEAAVQENYYEASVTDWIWEWGGGENDLLFVRFQGWVAREKDDQGRNKRVWRRDWFGRHMMNLFMWTLRFNQTSPCQSQMKAESGGWRLGRWAGMAGRDQDLPGKRDSGLGLSAADSAASWLGDLP